MKAVRVLAVLLEQHGDAVRLAVRDQQERLLAEAGTPGPTAQRYRSFRPIGGSRLTLVASFPVSAELYVLVLALFASGLVAVLIDTSMPRRAVLVAIKRSQARAIVSVDALLRHRL